MGWRQGIVYFAGLPLYNLAPLYIYLQHPLVFSLSLNAFKIGIYWSLLSTGYIYIKLAFLIHAVIYFTIYYIILKT